MEPGKIYWLSGEFKFFNKEEPDYWESEAQVESAIIDSNMIKFYIAEKDYGNGELIGYKVNLQATSESFYQGESRESETVFCELFENTSRFLMKGTWKEFYDDEEYYFTWILILNKWK